MAPRLPGRESSRTTVDSTEGLLIGSFIMQHEDKWWRRKCVITGCEHRMGPKTDEPGWAGKWEDCSDKALPAFVVHESNIEKHLGLVCSCHSAEILQRD